MLGVVAQTTRQRDSHAFRMKKVSVRSFASSVNKTMLLEISNELPNLSRHKDDITEGTAGKYIRWGRETARPTPI